MARNSIGISTSDMVPLPVPGPASERISHASAADCSQGSYTQSIPGGLQSWERMWLMHERAARSRAALRETG